MFIENGKQVCINVINKLAELKDDFDPEKLKNYIEQLPGVVGWFHDNMFGVECGKALQLLADLGRDPKFGVRVFVVYRTRDNKMNPFEIKKEEPYYADFLDMVNDLFLGEFGVYIRDTYELMK